MARHANLIVFAEVVICLLAALPVAAQSCATDNFEEGTLNSSFWTTETTGPGTASVQLGTYNGEPSVELETFAYGTGEFITHSLTSSAYGTVSVMVYYDNIYANGYKLLDLYSGSDAPPSSYHIYIDWGDLATYLYYPTTPPSGTWALTQLVPPKSTGWHQWTFASTPNGVTIQIDGATVFTQPIGFAFSAITLGTFGVAGSAYFAAFSFCPTSGCQVNPTDVKPFPGTPFSRDGKPLSMNATFAPTDANGAPVTLSNEETACGFTGFNWQQEIVSLPAPSGLFPVDQTAVNSSNLAADGSLQAPPPFPDPPFDGYLYEVADYNGNDNAWPFFWSATDLTRNTLPCTPALGSPIQTAYTMNFQDCPGDPNLPSGSAIQFQTSLVGVCGTDVTPTACNGVTPGYPSAPLFTWNWETTFNGDSKNPVTGVGGAQLKSVFPLDPNSGTGGVSITSINSVPQNPPSVSCTATPNSLWPPNVFLARMCSTSPVPERVATIG